MAAAISSAGVIITFAGRRRPSRKTHKAPVHKERAPVEFCALRPTRRSLSHSQNNHVRRHFAANWARACTHAASAAEKSLFFLSAEHKYVSNKSGAALNHLRLRLYQWRALNHIFLWGPFRAARCSHREWEMWWWYWRCAHSSLLPAATPFIIMLHARAFGPFHFTAKWTSVHTILSSGARLGEFGKCWDVLDDVFCLLSSKLLLRERIKRHKMTHAIYRWLTIVWIRNIGMPPRKICHASTKWRLMTVFGHYSSWSENEVIYFLFYFILCFVVVISKRSELLFFSYNQKVGSILNFFTMLYFHLKWTSKNCAGLIKQAEQFYVDLCLHFLPTIFMCIILFYDKPLIN